MTDHGVEISRSRIPSVGSCFSKIQPSQTALWEWICTRVSEEMLHEIAEDDRGDSAHAHVTALKAQVEGHAKLGLVPYIPRVVLELQCSAEPETQLNVREHMKRLFACVTLLRNAAHVRPAGRFSDELDFVRISAAAIIQLIRSSLALGEEVIQLSVPFLLWLYGIQKHPAFQPFVAFGLLLLRASDVSGASQEDLRCLCTLVEWQESQARFLLKDTIRSSRWLFGLNGFENLKGHRTRWLETTEQVFGPAIKRCTEETAAALRRLQMKLAGTLPPREDS